MNYEIIFLIPFIVGLAYVVREVFLYKREMKQWIDNPNWQFTLTEKDGLPYVTPRVNDDQSHQD